MTGDDRGPWLTVAMIMFLIWSILFYGVRLWARLRVKMAATDDVVVTCALVSSFVCQGMMYTAIDKGYGKESESLSTDTLRSIDKCIYTAHLFYTIAIGLTRVASALGIEHIAQHGPYTRRARAMAWLSGGWTFASLLAVAILPPYIRPWLAVDGQSTMFSRWIGIEATGLAVEVALLVPIVTLRLCYLAPRRDDDLNQSTIIAAIFTAGALQFSIIATSVTALKPFLTVFDQPKIAYGRSAESGDAYHKLELFRRVSRHLEVSDDSSNWRAYQGSVERTIVSEPDRIVTHKRGGSESEDRGRPYHGSATRTPRARDPVLGDGECAQMVAPERIIIQKTTEVVVHYEDNRFVV